MMTREERIIMADNDIAVARGKLAFLYGYLTSVIEDEADQEHSELLKMVIKEIKITQEHLENASHIVLFGTNKKE